MVSPTYALLWSMVDFIFYLYCSKALLLDETFIFEENFTATLDL